MHWGVARGCRHRQTLMKFMNTLSRARVPKKELCAQFDIVLCNISTNLRRHKSPLTCVFPGAQVFAKGMNWLEINFRNLKILFQAHTTPCGCADFANLRLPKETRRIALYPTKEFRYIASQKACHRRMHETIANGASQIENLFLQFARTRKLALEHG